MGILLLVLLVSCSTGQKLQSLRKDNLLWNQGAIIRGDTSQKRLALVFTGDEYADGGTHIRAVLRKQEITASFFFTGNFYRNNSFKSLIHGLKSDGHYLGAHSDKHLLYCDWKNRDSLLVNKTEFLSDLKANYATMSQFGIAEQEASYFLPPFEWYNDTISQWTKEAGFQLVNITYGTRSHADYTTPEMPNYVDSEQIYQSILDYEASHTSGFNGFILLIHIGTAPERKDKFYHHLENLIHFLKEKSYQLQRIDDLFN